MVARQIAYADALKILAVGHGKLPLTVDKLLGYERSGAAAGGGQLELLRLLNVRNDLVQLGGMLLSGFGDRLRTVYGQSRANLLVAAHTVIAVNSYLLALDDSTFLVDLSQIGFLETGQDGVAGGQGELLSREPTSMLIDTVMPPPSPHKPYEQAVLDMKARYLAMSQHLAELVKLRSAWRQYDKRRQMRFLDILLKDIPEGAAFQYDNSYRQLSTQSTEFRLWMYLPDSGASTAHIAKIGDNMERGFAGLHGFLDSLHVAHSPSKWSGRQEELYRFDLERPIIQTWLSEADAGLTFPSLAEAYVNPALRVAEYGPSARPTDEDWWHQQVVRYDDAQWFLAGYLTSPVAMEAPLVILGHPGSGKSLLTKILAARLPPQDFLSVRVELRDVPADSDLQYQIESTFLKETGERVVWPEFAETAGDVLLVMIFDGLDDMLQTTGMHYWDYIERVHDFQRREKDLGRRIVVIVTSRTVVADRFRFPEGTIFVKIEPFSENKISRWLQSWNSANDAYFKSRGLSPIPREAVLRHRDLAQQPLLLLMLALYDAGSNALQRNRGELARADLYERLLSAFVSRELDKYQLHLDSSTHAWRVDRELQRLSVMAFALFNRGRHTVTESDLDVDLGDLDADLGFLLPWNYDPEDMTSGFARDLTPAQLVVGRFFFVHQSRTLVDGGWRNSYEFLNVAFGEYLVARMVFHILNRIAKLRAADNQSFAPGISSNSADEHLWALLSFAPLTDWPQTVSFLAELFQQLADARCIEHWQTLSALFRKSLQPRKNGYGGYEPLFLNAPARHAAYSVNLAVLNLLAASRPISIKTLLATADLTVEEWQRFVLLWRSQLSSTSWQGLVGAKLFAKSNEFNLNETILKFLTTTGTFKEVASSGKQDEIQVSSPVSNASKRKSGEYAHPNIRPLRAFVSYSQKDERYRQALDAALAQLKRNALISVWHDRKILPGQGWDEEIDKNLEIADIILVLVSFDFLNSDYAYTREMQRAIERHKSGSATVVPIILRPSDWQTSPLGDLQALPSNGRPVSMWPNRDLAWLDVVQGLQELLSGQG